VPALQIDVTARHPHTAIKTAGRMVRRDRLIKFMAEGYCVKCKAKKEIADGVEEVMKNGRKAMKGKCPTCGTVMFKILGGKAVTPATPPSTPTPPPAAN